VIDVPTAGGDQVAFDVAPVGIALVNLDGTLRGSISDCATLLGYGRQEALELTPGALLQSEESSAEVESLGQLRAGTLARHLVAEKTVSPPRRQSRPKPHLRPEIALSTSAGRA